MKESTQDVESQEEDNGKSPLRTLVAIGSLVIAVAAFGFSWWTYRDTRGVQEEAAMVNAMNDHMRLSIDEVGLTVSPGQLTEGKYPSLTKQEKKYTWYASHALFTAETIYNLEVGEDDVWADVKSEYKDDPWVAAARQFVVENESYIRWNVEHYGSGTAVVCNQFSNGFISFMASEVPEVGEKC